MPTNIGGGQLGKFQLAGGVGPEVFERTVTSTLSLVQAISNKNEIITSTLNLSQAIVEHQVFNRTVTSTLSPSQNIVLVKDLQHTSTLSLSQTVAETHNKPRTVSQSIGLSQTIVKSYIGKRTIVQGVTWTHTRDSDTTFNKTLSQTLSQTQTIAEDHCHKVDSTLVLSQTISFVKLKHVHQTLALQQEVIDNVVFNRSIHSLTGLFQTLSRTMIHNEHVAHTLSLSQSIVQARVKGVTQALNLSQTVVGFNTKGVSNNIAFSQTIGYNHVSVKSVVSQLFIDQQLGLVRSRRASVHHGFGLNSFVREYRVNNRTINQALGVSQSIRRLVFNRTVTSTYSPNQVLVYKPVYPRTVQSNLLQTQVVVEHSVIKRTVTSNLTFLPNRQVYVGLGNTEWYTIENVQYALVKSKGLCVLQTNNAAITLPSPEFGDNENYGGVFTIRRSMNNVTYTHIRSLSLRKLQLPWVLSKRKAWELREFLIQNNDKLITVTTWKGDKWVVNLTTNPLELSVRGRYADENEKVSVELEFEGLKVM